MLIWCISTWCSRHLHSVSRCYHCTSKLACACSAVIPCSKGFGPQVEAWICLCSMVSCASCGGERGEADRCHSPSRTGTVAAWHPNCTTSGDVTSRASEVHEMVWSTCCVVEHTLTLLSDGVCYVSWCVCSLAHRRSFWYCCETTAALFHFLTLTYHMATVN